MTGRVLLELGRRNGDEFYLKETGQKWLQNQMMPSRRCDSLYWRPHSRGSGARLSDRKLSWHLQSPRFDLWYHTPKLSPDCSLNVHCSIFWTLSASCWNCLGALWTLWEMEPCWGSVPLEVVHETLLPSLTSVSSLLPDWIWCDHPSPVPAAMSSPSNVLLACIP